MEEEETVTLTLPVSEVRRIHNLIEDAQQDRLEDVAEAENLTVAAAAATASLIHKNTLEVFEAAVGWED